MFLSVTNPFYVTRIYDTMHRILRDVIFIRSMDCGVHPVILSHPCGVYSRRDKNNHYLLTFFFYYSTHPGVYEYNLQVCRRVPIDYFAYLFPFLFAIWRWRPRRSRVWHVFFFRTVKWITILLLLFFTYIIYFLWRDTFSRHGRNLPWRIV